MHQYFNAIRTKRNPFDSRKNPHANAVKPIAKIPMVKARLRTFS